MQLRKARSLEVLFLGGWLFSDLLLLLTLLFFVGNVDTRSPKATPTPPPLPRLELQYKRITLSIDPDALLNDSPSEKDAIKQQIKQWDGGLLATRRVGLAIVYAGTGTSPVTQEQIITARAIDYKIYTLLDDLGKQGFAFNHAFHYDPLFLYEIDRHTAVIDVYLFAQ